MGQEQCNGCSLALRQHLSCTCTGDCYRSDAPLDLEIYHAVMGEPEHCCGISCIVRMKCEGIKHNNTTPLSRFLFFWNFTIGQTGSNMFCKISQKRGFSLNLFVQIGWTSDFVLKQTKRRGGGFLMKCGTFSPSKLAASATSTPRLQPRRV